MAWSAPVPGGRFVDDFGPRSTGIPGASTFHQGVDLSRGDGLVRSAGDGIVQAVGTNSVRGRCVIVRHDDGTTTTYQHLATVDVKTGQRVSGGSRLGVQGATGTASAIHLHFEVFPAGRFLITGSLAWASPGRAVDPELFMRARGVDLRTGTITTTNPGGGTGGSAISVPNRPTFTPPIPIPQEDDMLPTFIRRSDGRIVALLAAGAHHVTQEEWAVWTNLGQAKFPDGMGAMDSPAFQKVIDTYGGYIEDDEISVEALAAAITARMPTASAAEIAALVAASLPTGTSAPTAEQIADELARRLAS